MWVTTTITTIGAQEWYRQPFCIPDGRRQNRKTTPTLSKKCATFRKCSIKNKQQKWCWKEGSLYKDLCAKPSTMVTAMCWKPSKMQTSLFVLPVCLAFWCPENYFQDWLQPWKLSTRNVTMALVLKVDRATKEHSQLLTLLDVEETTAVWIDGIG